MTTGWGPEPLDFSDPRALSLRQRDRSPLVRFVAHLLIRLTVIGTLPEHMQVLAALFPASVIWPIVRPEPKVAPGALVTAGASLRDDNNGDGRVRGTRTRTWRGSLPSPGATA